MVVDQIMGHISLTGLKSIVGGDNASFNHFFLYPQCFEKPSSLTLLPDMAILGFFKFSRKCRYDVKNMDKWGYNYPIE